MVCGLMVESKDTSDMVPDKSNSRKNKEKRRNKENNPVLIPSRKQGYGNDIYFIDHIRILIQQVSTYFRNYI